ncbi:MAG: hypothetical protein P4M11_06885 [Candidatus Pacebacteria bacterium]|nr:hypothetical protein [Candidatus Paceibacterota bacterium]
MESKRRSLEETCKLSATYNFRNSDLRPGMLIDMNDKIMWRVAVVKSCAESTVDVRYEAWGPSCDESRVPKTSALLAPFRSRSVGYTGQKSQAYREFVYSKAEKDKYASIMRTLMTNRFECVPPESAAEFTQFLRGELVIYIDSLLTLFYYYMPKPDDLREIFAFIDLFMEFVVAWIRTFPAWAAEYEAARKYHLLYLVDPVAAAAMSFPELADVLKVCFGGDWRRVEKSYKVLCVPLRHRSTQTQPSRKRSRWARSGVSSSSIPCSNSMKDSTSSSVS